MRGISLGVEPSASQVRLCNKVLSCRHAATTAVRQCKVSTSLHASSSSLLKDVAYFEGLSNEIIIPR